MSTAKFCPQCGAPRTAKARFCAECGSAFSDDPPPAKRAARAPQRSAASRGSAHPPPIPQPTAAAATWQVAVGDSLPDARRLFTIPTAKKSRAVRSKPPETGVHPAGRGKSLWGSTLWMGLTQGADIVTRELQASPNDPNLSLRLTLASAVAVFGVTLTSMPKLRSVLVRLGTAGMAVLQGQGVWPVLQQAMLDPSILGSFAPNLAAQAAGMMALLKLFKSASGKSVA